jgi:hypothetical protein
MTAELICLADHRRRRRLDRLAREVAEIGRAIDLLVWAYELLYEADYGPAAA